jgi:hypothetical protein
MASLTIEPISRPSHFFRSSFKCSCQLLGNVLVENFLHGQGDDDFVAAFEK